MNGRGLASLGLLTWGWGIGTALAFLPGVAAADSAADWFPSIDNFAGGLALAAPAISTLDYQVSIDGYDLFPTAGNLATATSGVGDIAIAFGNGSDATATSGVGDFAMADGTGSTADTDFSSANFDAAIANGTGSTALVGTGNLDAAIANGEDSFAVVGGRPGEAPSNFDFGSASGTDSYANVGVGSSNYGSAVGTDSNVAAGGGNNDVATVFDPTGTAGSTAHAVNGNDDFASIVGDHSSTHAGGVDGLLGSNDIATVFDPAGTVGSTADAGASPTAAGDFDLGAVFGDALSSTGATGGNYLVDILPTL